MATVQAGEEILSGKWPQHSRLPADAALARTLGVGMNTVRRALSVLVDEGLLERRRGSGTFVVGAPAPSRQARLIGLFVPSVRRYFTDLVAGVESVVHARGGHLLLQSTEYNRTRERQQIAELLERKPDGLILTPTLVGLADPEDYLHQLESIECPVVLAERVPPRMAGRYPYSPLSYATTDTRRGGHLAVEHLYEQGCRRIGLMSSRNTPTSEGLHQGFIEAVHAFDLSADRAIARWPPCSPDRMAQYIEEYAEMVHRNGIQGVVCLDDGRAKQLVPHLRAAGLDIPGDVKLVAFEDEGVRDSEVPLTSVVPARQEVGRLAAEILMGQLDRGTSEPTTEVVVAPELVVRRSTMVSA
ncbi:substrate-binding domain-containing protein [Microlunatus sp. Y2014]|uniref:LacI family DNA-binding transcriptional regulator n=1 Tax=Microlunatus sp. Y2014 TaxID=3418488 RepID=UPI003DA76B52